MEAEIIRKDFLGKNNLPRLNGLWGMYLSDLFRRIAISLIGLFVPIYIWQETEKLIYIPIFYFIYAFFGFLTQYPGAKIIKKIGVDWGIVIGTIFRFLYIYFLILAKNNINYFWLSALAFGFCQPFDWLCYFYVITKESNKKKKFGNTAGITTIIGYLGASLGPIIGGVIIKTNGYETLYYLACVMLIFVAGFPFLDNFEKKGMHVEFGDLKKAFFDKGIGKHFFTNGIRVFDAISNTILWPIFLFFSIGSISKSGEIQTISLVLAMGISYIVGKMVDGKNFFMMYVGVIFNFFAWVLRFITGNNLGLLISNMSFTLGSTMLWTPYSALLFARSSKKYTMQFWMVREMISYFMMSIACLFYIILFYFFKEINSFKLVFLLLSLVNLLALTVPRLYKKYIILIKKI